jgi:hypothetical protein
MKHPLRIKTLLFRISKYYTRSQILFSQKGFSRNQGCNFGFKILIMNLRKSQLALTLTLLALLLILPFSCRHETIGIDSFEVICFEREILPIFQSSCGISGCHDPNAKEAGLNLSNYAGIIKGINPGEPLNSKIYLSLKDIWSDEMMPPNQPMPEQNRTRIRLWIEQGANYTTCPDSSGEGALRACFQRDILPVMISSCAISGCHDAITAEEDLVYTTYAGVMESVKPFNPGSSDLYDKITETDLSDRMPPPPYEALTQSQIDSVFKWISYGALNEVCAASCDTLSPVSFNGTVWPIIENSCRGCHSGASPGGGILLTNYSEVNAQVATGNIPGVLRGGSYILMPPAGGLSDCSIRMVELWVAAGAQNNK